MRRRANRRSVAIGRRSVGTLTVRPRGRTRPRQRLCVGERRALHPRGVGCRDGVLRPVARPRARGVGEQNSIVRITAEVEQPDEKQEKNRCQDYEFDECLTGLPTPRGPGALMFSSHESHRYSAKTTCPMPSAAPSGEAVESVNPPPLIVSEDTMRSVKLGALPSKVIAADGI
jgi:hypothetical protein